MFLVVLALMLAWSVAVYRNPIYAVAGTMMVYVFEQYSQYHVPLFVAEPALINIFFGGLVLLALARRLFSARSIAAGISHPMLILLGMYLLHPVSALWAPDPGMTISNFVRLSPYVLVLTFLTALIVADVEDLEASLRGIWLCGTVLLVLILTTASFAKTGRGLELHRFESSATHQSNPLALAGAGGAVAIIAMVLKPLAGWKGRLLCGASAVVGLYTCVRSGSRGQFIGAVFAIAISLGIQIWIGRTRLWKVTLLTTFGAGLMAWLFAQAAEQFGDRFGLSEMRDVYSTARIGPSEAMIDIWAAGGPWTWIWGLGGSSSYHYIGFYPHVVPVEVLAELGVIGLLLYVAFAAMVVMRLRWLLKTVPWERCDAVICTGALFTFEWILALKQGALLGADFMMCHGLIMCSVAQNVRLRNDAPVVPSARQAPSSSLVPPVVVPMALSAKVRG